MQGDGDHIVPDATPTGVALITTHGHRARTYLAQRALEGFINTNFKGIRRGLRYYHVHFTEDGNERPHTEVLCGVTKLWVTRSLRCCTAEPMHNCLEAELTGMTH